MHAWLPALHRNTHPNFVHAGSSGGRCLYVSGVPGTGKTATVLETMRSLRRKAEAGQLAPFQFVEINSLRLPSPQHAYTHLYEVIPLPLMPHLLLLACHLVTAYSLTHPCLP